MMAEALLEKPPEQKSRTDGCCETNTRARIACPNARAMPENAATTWNADQAKLRAATNHRPNQNNNAKDPD